MLIKKTQRSDPVTLGTSGIFLDDAGWIKLFDAMSQNAGVKRKKIEWCDLRCRWSGAAKLEALDGSCHTFQSLWCNKLKQHVTKNAPCEVLFGKRRPTVKL